LVTVYNMTMGDDVLETNHLYRPRGQGWCFRHRTPDNLVGRTNPRTGKPFGKEIRLGLQTRDLREARHKRDMILGELRKLQAEHSAQNVASLGDAIEMAKEYRRAVNTGDWGSEFVLEDMARDEAERIERVKGEAVAVRWFQTARAQGTPFSTYMDEWLDRPNVADKTRYEQRKTLEAFRDHHEDPFVETFTVKLVSSYIHDVLMKSSGNGGSGSAKGATVNKKISALSSFWKYLRRRGIVETNPWDGQSVYVEPNEKRPYDWSELRRLMQSDKLTPLLRDAITLALFTGARLEDIARLHVDDLEDGGIHIRHGKTKSNARWVPLCDPIRSIVNQRAERSGEYILNELSDGAWDKRSASLSKKYGRLRDHVFGKGMGAQIDAHSFRRTYGWAAEQIADGIMHARLLGHAAPTLGTSRYSAGAFRERLATAQEGISSIILDKTGRDLWGCKMHT
jgi:integrase